jgi:hypothetical protein
MTGPDPDDLDAAILESTRVLVSRVEARDRRLARNLILSLAVAYLLAAAWLTWRLP